MEKFIKNNERLIKNISIIGLAILFSYILFDYVFKYIAPFIIGWLLSLIYNPLVDFLEKRFKVKRWLGTLIAILILIGFFSSVVTGAVLKLVSEAELFMEKLPEYIEHLKVISINLIENIENFTKNIPFINNIEIGITNINISDIITPIIKTGGSSSFTLVKAIPGFFMLVIMALLSSYFFAKDKYEIKRLIKKHLPISENNHWLIIKNKLSSSLGGYFKTQLILMCYTFTICIIGLIVIKSPYALLLSFVTSVIDALPFFGSGFILWPATVIYLFSGEYFLAVGYIVIYLIINLMRQIMQPKILGTQIGIHPLMALISMYVGLKLLGVLGMIIGPIIAVIIQAFFEASEESERNKKTDTN